MLRRSWCCRRCLPLSEPTAPSCAAFAQRTGVPVKVGLILPPAGTYANLGTMIENGFQLCVALQGTVRAGREIRHFKVDDESEPAKTAKSISKLVGRERIDVPVDAVLSAWRRWRAAPAP